MSEPVRAWIEAQGGSILGLRWSSGWLEVRLPGRALEALMERTDLVALASGTDTGQPACDGSCTLGYNSDVKLGDLRDEERIGLDYFLTHNPIYDANSLDVSILEYDLFEDDALGFHDNHIGTSRIAGRYDCSTSPCTSYGNFSDESPANSDHGTMVASILAADYEDDQALATSYGDSCWDGVSHCNAWKRAASGAAPEVDITLMGELGSQRAIEKSIALDMDVVSMSFGEGTDGCDPASSNGIEDAVEDAFDDGIFVVVASGNNNAGGSVSCDIESPADTNKSFAVNAVDMSDANCEADYQDCPLDMNKHMKGGATLTINGTPRSGAYSGIDIVGPNKMRYATDHAGASGIVDESQTAGGTSAATPFTAGSALLVKDWLLSDGETWVSSPGRLHTVMLAMADRYEGVGTPSYRTTTTDSLWGMGRLKLRLLKDDAGLGDVGWKMSTYTRTTTGTTTYLYHSSPIPNGTDMFKCVLMEDEDFSGHSDAGDIYLWIVLKNPVSGSCSTGGSTITSRTDSTYDLKHFVAFEDSQQNIEGVCPEINVITSHIADSSITFHVFCYYAEELDRNPH